jgi:hypothetical protein
VLPDGFFKPKMANFGKFWSVLQRKTLVNFMAIFGYFTAILVYFMAIWYILWPFGIFYGHLVYFMAIWYILWPFGIFCGNFGIVFPF